MNWKINSTTCCHCSARSLSTHVLIFFRCLQILCCSMYMLGLVYVIIFKYYIFLYFVKFRICLCIIFLFIFFVIYLYIIFMFKIFSLCDSSCILVIFCSRVFVLGVVFICVYDMFMYFLFILAYMIVLV